MKKFPASIPRKMFTKSEVGNSDFCPVCGARLENENHTYLIVVKSKNDFDSFVMGNDFGYFCLNCPVVVVDYDSFSDLLIAANKVTPTSRFIVAGMVDLDAIPEEKSRVPIGSQDNQVPLVEFIKPSKTPTSVKNSSGKKMH